MSKRRSEPRRYDHRKDDKMDFETTQDVSITSSFEDFKLKEDLLRGIYAYSMLTVARYY